MFEFGLLETILIVVILMTGYPISRKINRGKYLGDLIYKIKEDHDSIEKVVLWWVIILLILLTLLLNGRRMLTVLSPFTLTALTIIALMISINGILKGMFNKELREKGIIQKGKHYYWEDMLEHVWEEDRVFINFKAGEGNNKVKSIIWFVKDEDMEDIMEILEKQEKK